jgi:hypothetical protein
MHGLADKKKKKRWSNLDIQWTGLADVTFNRFDFFYTNVSKIGKPYISFDLLDKPTVMVNLKFVLNEFF